MQAGSLCYKQSHTKKPKTEFVSKHNSTPDDAARKWWWLWSLQHHSTKLMVHVEWLLFYRVPRVPMQRHLLYLQQFRCDLWCNKVQQAPKTKNSITPCQASGVPTHVQINTSAFLNRKQITEVNVSVYKTKPLKLHGFTASFTEFHSCNQPQRNFLLIRGTRTPKNTPLCELWIRIKQYVSTTMYALCELHVPLCWRKAHSSPLFCSCPDTKLNNASTFQRFWWSYFDKITWIQKNFILARQMSSEFELIEKNLDWAPEKMSLKRLLDIVQWFATGSLLCYITFTFS